MATRAIKQRTARCMGRNVAALLFALFATTPSMTQAAVESVAPVKLWCDGEAGGCTYPTDIEAAKAVETTYNSRYAATNPYHAYLVIVSCNGGGLCLYHFVNDLWTTVDGPLYLRRVLGCPIPMINPAIPYTYKYASGMCEREAQCPAPNTINPATGQCEPPKVLTIILEGGTTTEPSTLLPFNAVVKDQNGVVQAGKQVIITANAQDSTGGHIHTENRPKGIFTCGSMGSPWTCTLTTDNSGQAPFEFVATPISGTHTITATCAGCSNTETKSVDVKLNGLIPIPGSSRYALSDSKGVIGAVTNKHTANHYLTSTAITGLKGLANIYAAVNPGAKLYLNDASLVWGGLFDVGSTPWLSPHSLHDKGRSLDIRAANSGPNNEGAVPATLFLRFIEDAKKKGFNIGLHCKNSSDTNYCLGQPNNRHFHVDF